MWAFYKYCKNSINFRCEGFTNIVNIQLILGVSVWCECEPFINTQNKSLENSQNCNFRASKIMTKYFKSNLIGRKILKFPHCGLGVPTSKKISSDLAGSLIFRTIFHEDFKNVNFIIVGHTQSTRQLCPRSPRTGSATGYVGRVGASMGFVWSKNQEGYFC